MFDKYTARTLRFLRAFSNVYLVVNPINNSIRHVGVVVLRQSPHTVPVHLIPNILSDGDASKGLTRFRSCCRDLLSKMSRIITFSINNY